MSQPIYKRLGARIKILRGPDQSQQKLADRSEMSRPNLAAIERGEQRVWLHQIAPLAKALNVSIETLLEGVFGGGKKGR